jgi:putative membrane protein insertion efficiency factor
MARGGLTARLLRGTVRFYQLAISPMLPPRCRFYPTCSAYAIEALTEHGALRGSLLTVQRLCRCHPFGGQGYDPVPKARQGLQADRVDR